MDKPDPPATANESKASSKCDTVMTDAVTTSTVNGNDIDTAGMCAPSTTNVNLHGNVSLDQSLSRINKNSQ